MIMMIIACLDQCLSSLFLNWLIVDEFTTASGKLVHIITVLSVRIVFSYVIPYNHTLHSFLVDGWGSS